jgi:hypothetical protein
MLLLSPLLDEVQFNHPGKIIAPFHAVISFGESFRNEQQPRAPRQLHCTVHTNQRRLEVARISAPHHYPRRKCALILGNAVRVGDGGNTIRRLVGSVDFNQTFVCEDPRGSKVGETGISRWRNWFGSRFALVRKRILSWRSSLTGLRRPECPSGGRELGRA